MIMAHFPDQDDCSNDNYGSLGHTQKKFQKKFVYSKYTIIFAPDFKR